MKCQVTMNTAVLTRAGGEKLSYHYDCVVHNLHPFFESTQNDKNNNNDNDNENDNTHTNDLMQDLSRWYQSSFHLAQSLISTSNSILLCCPLLGTSARGFLTRRVDLVAAIKSSRWMNERNKSTPSDESDQTNDNTTAVFGSSDLAVVSDLVHALEELTST